MCASQGFIGFVIMVLAVTLHIVLLSVLTYWIPQQWARYQRAVLFWGAIGMPLSLSASRPIYLLALPLWHHAKAFTYLCVLLILCSYLVAALIAMGILTLRTTVSP